MRQVLQTLFRPDLTARAEWDKTLVWFRLRYQEATGVENCLTWLSQTQKPGRVALYCQVGTLVKLYVGIPGVYTAVLNQMAVDYGFSLVEEKPVITAPTPRLFRCETVNWQAGFTAHLVQGQMFVSQPPGAKGSYFPQVERPRKGQPAGQGVCLPTPPPLGMAQQADWPATPDLPRELLARWREKGRWPLGKTAENIPLSTDKPLNLYGESERVADWLLAQVQHLVMAGEGNLVVIDGKGNLVPRLKRKASIMERLGSQITYLDLDNQSNSVGFNPLAMVPGECETAVLGRWVMWLDSMGGACTVPLLQTAWDKGVRSVPGLRQWLNLPEQQQEPLLTPLHQAVETLCRTRRVREWLDWPKGCLSNLPEGVTLFSCQATGEAEKHILNSVVLGAMQVGARVIMHGFPWQTFPQHPILNDPQVVMTNAPLLPDNLTVLVQSGPKQADFLAKRFFPDQAEETAENLLLLQPGETILLADCGVFWSSWRSFLPKPET